MGIRGMDADAVEDVGRGLGQQADLAAQVMTAIDELMSQAAENWVGGDSDRFREAWVAQHRPAVDRVRDALDRYGATALAQAAEQHRASS